MVLAALRRHPAAVPSVVRAGDAGVHLRRAALPARAARAMLGARDPDRASARCTCSGSATTSGNIGPWMPDRRYFIYPIYFALGMWVAQRGRGSVAATGCCWRYRVVGLLWWARLYEHPSTDGRSGRRTVAVRAADRPVPAVEGVRFDVPLLSAVGRDSLFFYLWHPLAFALWRQPGLSGAPLLALSLGVDPARLGGDRAPAAAVATSWASGRAGGAAARAGRAVPDAVSRRGARSDGRGFDCCRTGMMTVAWMHRVPCLVDPARRDRAGDAVVPHLRGRRSCPTTRPGCSCGRSPRC